MWFQTVVLVGLFVSRTAFGQGITQGMASTVSVAAATPNPSVFGSLVNITATVGPLAATGSVTFYNGAQVLGGSNLTGGSATLSTFALPAGTTNLTAYYGGDGIYAASRSSALSHSVNAVASGAFAAAPGSPFAVDPITTSVVVGDFNGDGKADLAIANFNNGTVSILLGNGNGGFTLTSGSPLAIGGSPNYLVVGDFNGDGKADLAIANDNNTVTALLGDGNGGFVIANGSPFTTGSNAPPRALAVGDFNGDGRTDLAVTNLGFGVTVLLGDGTGGFTPASGAPFSTGRNPTEVAVGDFNGDGNADLAVVNQLDDTISILLGNGSGSFPSIAASPATLGALPLSLVVADFDGDGKADLAVSNGYSDTVTVLLGNGSGGFSPASGSPFAVGAYPTSLSVGDFNGDGKPDLAVGSGTGTGTVTVLLGNGNGTFTPASYGPFTLSYGYSSVVVADFNGDGRADLAVLYPNTNITILLGSPAPIPAARFVTSLYTDLLFRQPDPSGVSFWVGELNSGVESQAQVAAHFFTSPEFSGGGLAIIQYYIAVLGRDPDYGGWSFWFNGYINNRVPLSSILGSFLQSPEFQNTYGANLTNQQFLNLVYQNVLGRPPDPGGNSSWLGVLSSGASRGYVFGQFILSAEFQTKSAPRAYASLLYMGFLKRTAEPGGLAYWTSVLQNLNNLPGAIGAFITSPEYLARFP